MENTAIQDFVIVSLSGDANTTQQAQLQEWLRASDGNRSLYEEIKRIWDTPVAVFDREQGWETLMAQVKPAASHNWWWLKIAAVVIPLLMLCFLFKPQQWHTYIASGALKDSLVLPDGSRVYLKPGTVLSYNNQREVKLQNGEAFFKVTQNDKHSFIITAGNATVKVLGTSFNVRRTPVCTDVTVWDGKVSLAGKRSAVILTMGNMGIVDQYTGEVCKKEGNYAYRCGWANNELTFNNQPLKLVLEELSASYHVQLKTADTTILQRKVTIRFSEMPLAEALAILSETMDIHILVQGIVPAP
jgi:transmembrane sensor